MPQQCQSVVSTIGSAVSSAIGSIVGGGSSSSSSYSSYDSSSSYSSYSSSSYSSSYSSYDSSSSSYSSDSSSIGFAGDDDLGGFDNNPAPSTPTNTDTVFDTAEDIVGSVGTESFDNPGVFDDNLDNSIPSSASADNDGWTNTGNNPGNPNAPGYYNVDYNTVNNNDNSDNAGSGYVGFEEGDDPGGFDDSPNADNGNDDNTDSNDDSEDKKKAIEKINLSIGGYKAATEAILENISKTAAKVAAKASVVTGIVLETIEIAAADTKEQKKVETAGLAGSVAGALAGGKVGAWAGAGVGGVVGSVIPGVGTVVGTAIGGTVGFVAGAVFGAWGAEKVAEAITESILDTNDSGTAPPVLIDLDGDGKISMLAAKDSSVYYDFTGDGFAHRTGWVKGNDGFLAYDKNSDGVIQDHDELSFIGYVSGAKTDLAGLQHFDTNGNGELDSGDAEWDKFRIWQDTNENGISEDGELLSLSELDILKLNLTSDGNAYEQSGNTISGETVFTKADGTTIAGFDASLSLIGHPMQILSFDNAVSIISKNSTGDISEYLMYTDDAAHSLTLDFDSITRAVLGGDGIDTFTATGDRAVIFMGYGGDDVLTGGTGGDVLIGGEGKDTLRGKAGDDVLYLEGHLDHFYGGVGADTFILSNQDAIYADFNVQTREFGNLIHDFNATEDKLDLSALKDLRSINDLTFNTYTLASANNTENYLEIAYSGQEKTGRIVLHNASARDVTSDNFVFVETDTLDSSASHIPNHIADGVTVRNLAKTYSLDYVFEYDDWEIFGYSSKVTSHDGYNVSEGLGALMLSTTPIITQTQSALDELFTEIYGLEGKYADHSYINFGLGLEYGTIKKIDQYATNGSAIQSKFKVQKGDIVSFDYMFETSDYDPFIDFAVGSLGGIALRFADVTTVGSWGNSGWKTVSFVAPETAQLGFGVLNSRDEVVSSNLLIDNVRINYGNAPTLVVGQHYQLPYVFEKVDTSETLIIEIRNIPNDAWLSAGTKTDDGIWRLTETEYQGLNMNFGRADVGQHTLNVRAITQDGISKSVHEQNITIKIIDAIAVDDINLSTTEDQELLLTQDQIEAAGLPSGVKIETIGSFLQLEKAVSSVRHDGQISIKPDLNHSDQVVLQYQARDEQGALYYGNINLDIKAVADAPTLVAKMAGDYFLSFADGTLKNWKTIGNVKITQSAAGFSGSDSDGHIARLSTKDGVSQLELENFMGSEQGMMDSFNGDATSGSAMQMAVLDVEKGDKIIFDFIFNTEDITVFNDFAMIRIGDDNIKLFDVEHFEFLGEPWGWHSFGYMAKTSGKLNFAVSNVLNESGESALMIDNVRVIKDDIVDLIAGVTVTTGFDINALQKDTDGSEVLSIHISGINGKLSLSSGQQNADGSWVLTTEDLVGLQIITEKEFSGYIDMTIEARSTELSNGDTASTTRTLIYRVIKTGSSGDDTLIGDSGDNILKGLDGDDYLTGGAGNDLFIFQDDGSTDTISDFLSGNNKLDFSEYEAFENMGDLSLSQNGQDVHISSTNDDALIVILQNITLAEINSNQFVFVA